MSSQPCGTGPILCAPLIRKVDAALIDLLRSLSPAEWELQTIVPSWKVRDVAAHLLDTPLRKLSMVRDSCLVEDAPRDIVTMVNRMNREGVTVFRRLSPPVLIELMQFACAQSAGFHESLDPFAPAAFAVQWAGEEKSPNWFDTARELTERWHHQQQIRLATNRPGLMEPEVYHPVLDCFARGLPCLYRDVHAAAGTTLLLEIPGDSGGKWFLRRTPAGWGFVDGGSSSPAARVVIPPGLAWRLFTKGVDRKAARAQVEIEGDLALGERVLDLTAIIG